jgi:hypothetical protein
MYVHQYSDTWIWFSDVDVVLYIIDALQDWFRAVRSTNLVLEYIGFLLLDPLQDWNMSVRFYVLMMLFRGQVEAM